MRCVSFFGALRALVLGSLVLAAPIAAQAADAPGGVTHHIKTVFIILMENHNWTGDDKSIAGKKRAHYIDNVLVPMGSHAEQYYNPPGLHPSLPNYLWLEAGTNFGILHDGLPKKNGQDTTQHLVTLLDNAGVSWKAYLEDAKGGVCPLHNMGPVNADGNPSFAGRYEPFSYFHDVTDNYDKHSQYCIEHLRPFGNLAKDLQKNDVARYNWITPNLCNDMHDNCDHGAVRNGDQWLKDVVPMIMSSAAYQDGGALFITFDEANTGDGPIPMLVLSPFAKGHGYSNDIPYTHGSTLRTMQEIFGVGPFLRGAANANDLSDLFASFP